MQKESNQTSNTDESAQQEQKVGYPDISKADTKTVVLLSFIVIVIVFILSIVFPQTPTVDGTTEQGTTTEVTTEISNIETDTSGLFNTDNRSNTSATAEVFSPC